MIDWLTQEFCSLHDPGCYGSMLEKRPVESEWIKGRSTEI
jgi:hypothetical protein